MNQKTLFLRYLIFLCGFLLVSGLYLPAHYHIPYPAPLVAPFTPIVKKDHLRAVERKRPDLVLIGDSVLDCGVEAALLSDRLGIKSYTIYVPGSGTAAWYLLMKNVILEADYRPKYIAILFRSTMLTTPQYRTTGKYKELLDDYATDNEPLLINFAFISQMSPLEKFSQQYIPLYSVRLEIREDLDNFLRYQPPSVLFRCDRRCTKSAISSLFGMQVDVSAFNEAMEDAAKILNAPDEMNFKNQVNDSFLPYIIQLAQKNNVKLFFIRTTRASGELPAMGNYTKSLDAYLAEQDQIFLIDFIHDPRIKKDFYADDLHFNEYGKWEFTKILANEMLKVIENNK